MANKSPKANGGNTSGSDAANDTKKPAPAPAKPSSKPSSSSMLFLVIPIVIALIGGLYATVLVPPSASDTPFVSSSSSSANTSSAPLGGSVIAVDQAAARRVEKQILAKYPHLHDKYTSPLVHITTQQLLTPSPVDAPCPAFDIVGDLAPVVDAMARGTDDLRANNLVFLMLNGENDGVYVRWHANDKCLRELAMAAAQRLGADVDVLQNGVKLMTQMGLPITTSDQLDTDANRIAHVLLDFQIWVWPGIKVGYEFDVDGVKVTTLSMKPRVFKTEGFFTEDEAQEIMLQGINNLERSPVDSPEASPDGYHSDRTSFTAFLSDNSFTRDFRARTAKLTRLPSPSFVERMQLVRYETGQFFRKHEDYFDSKKFVPKDEIAHDEYKAWTEWAAAKIRALQAQGDVVIPEDYREGGKLFPNFDDKIKFQHAFLQTFLDEAVPAGYFAENALLEWQTWIEDNVANRANDIVTPLLRDKGYILPHMIKAWENRAGIDQLKYTIPKRPLSAVTHYFRWLRWAKERVQNLMDEDVNLVPAAFRPSGPHYPTYNLKFQNILVKFILEDNTEEALKKQFGDEWTKWLLDNKDSKDVLWEGLKVTKDIFDLAVQSFTKRAGDKFTYETPKHLQHFEPNRFVTVFLYLNDCPEGGETVFPYSKERLVTGIEREGMQECSEGLAVPPTKLTAAMFYAQTPENFPDPASLHGGCPPARGIKYGANSFAWNADADEGANAWDLGADLKHDPTAED